MAEHKVQLPDNSVITIEGPEDATDQELIDAASQHYSKKQAEKSGPISAIASGAQNAKSMDAMTYGAGAAGLAALGAAGKSLKDKFFSAESPAPRVEPQMDVNQQKPSEPFLEPETQTVRPTDWESSLSEEDRKLLERSRANAAVKATQSVPTTAPVSTIAPAPTVAPTVAPAQTAVAVNPKVPALLQPPANAVVPPAVSEPVPAPVLPTTPLKTEAAPVQAEPAPVAEAPKEKPAKAPKVQTEEQRIVGAKNWFVSHFGGRNDPQAHAAYDRLVKEVLNGKPPMMGPSGGVPPEFNQFKDWYEKNLQGPPKPSREALKAAIASVPRGAVAPPSLRPNEIGQGGSFIRGLTDPLQLKQ